MTHAVHVIQVWKTATFLAHEISSAGSSCLLILARLTLGQTKLKTPFVIGPPSCIIVSFKSASEQAARVRVCNSDKSHSLVKIVEPY